MKRSSHGDGVRLPLPMGKNDPMYAVVWGQVDAAVREALRMHPEYLRDNVPRRVIRASINKRVVPAVLASLKRRGTP